MKYAKIINNDILNGEGVCVSLWLQGCPHHCPNCHNPELWGSGGIEEKDDIVFQKISNAIQANGIQRNFSILGGEPLADYPNPNIVYSKKVLKYIKQNFPNIKTYVWTGYTIEELKQKYGNNIDKILKNIDVLIDGRYDETQRDITLKLRGSKNQRVLRKNIDF